jgi:hypothetical protein
MFDSDELCIECATCIGCGTTACSDCVVAHLLANDDGPINFMPIRLSEVPRIPTPDEMAIEMFTRSGLLGASPQFVPIDEFESYATLVRADRHTRV